MAPPSKQSSQAKQAKPAASPVKTGYLVLYNAVSAIAWSVVLARTVTVAATEGWQHVYPRVGEWTKWTQTMAALEILHSLLGMLF
jgi:very-long-chain (3R)-3-hydroxyacyl-CoA dehydratase